MQYHCPLWNACRLQCLQFSQLFFRFFVSIIPNSSLFLIIPIPQNFKTSDYQFTRQILLPYLPEFHRTYLQGLFYFALPSDRPLHLWILALHRTLFFFKQSGQISTVIPLYPMPFILIPSDLIVIFAKSSLLLLCLQISQVNTVVCAILSSFLRHLAVGC